MGDLILRIGSVTYEFLSAEWLLTRSHLPNGSVVIIVRALCTAVIVYSGVLLAMNLIDPMRSWEFSTTELRRQLLDTGKWFGAIFVGVYTALYTRFASQWAYVAGIYNQIKAAECRNIENQQPLIEWKVGFIEDADALHVAAKPAIASVIRHWAEDPEVKAQFAKDVPNGDRKLIQIMKRVDAACAKTA
jgi:hypothetical protein